MGKKRDVVVTMELTVETTKTLDELGREMIHAVTIRSVDLWLERRGIEYRSARCARVDAAPKKRRNP